MSADLEARLRTLEDLTEIHQLFVDYGTRNPDGMDYSVGQKSVRSLT